MGFLSGFSKVGFVENYGLKVKVCFRYCFMTTTGSEENFEKKNYNLFWPNLTKLLKICQRIREKKICKIIFCGSQILQKMQMFLWRHINLELSFMKWTLGSHCCVKEWVGQLCYEDASVKKHFHFYNIEMT